MAKNTKLKRIQSKYQKKNEYILRDFLAMERTTLANERTIFSYIRTSFNLVVVGIAFIELEGFKAVQWLGYALFAVSAFLIIFGIYRYHVMQGKLNNYYKAMEDEEKKEGDNPE